MVPDTPKAAKLATLFQLLISSQPLLPPQSGPVTQRLLAPSSLCDCRASHDSRYSWNRPLGGYWVIESYKQVLGNCQSGADVIIDDNDRLCF